MYELGKRSWDEKCRERGVLLRLLIMKRSLGGANNELLHEWEQGGAKQI